jgi:nucleoside recognition membrane protein YjiH
LKKAFKALLKAKEEDGRPLGALLGDAVRNSVNTLLMVGGFIILFSVIIDMLVRTGILGAAADMILSFGKNGLDRDFVTGILGGVFEITIGSRMISNSSTAMHHKIAAVSLIIGWSGFSIHAQTAGILSKSGIHFPLYMLTKLGQGLLAALISYPVTALIYPIAWETISGTGGAYTMSWQETATASCSFLAGCLVFIAAASLAAQIPLRAMHIFKKLTSTNRIK